MKLNCALETSVDSKEKKKGSSLSSENKDIILSCHVDCTTDVKGPTLLVYIWFCFLKSFKSFIELGRQLHGLTKGATHPIKYQFSEVC